MLFRFVPEMPLIENRTLSAWPPVIEPSHRFVRGASDWFNDNFGLRSAFVRIKTQIDYSLFHTSDRVHIGKHGWLFYRSVLDVERPEVESYLSKNFDNVRTGIVQLSQALQRNGIQTTFIVNELADRFYPDMVPGSALPAPPDPLVRKLSRSLVAVGSLFEIDVTSSLTELAKTRQVFHKTDFHWNDPAAFTVAQKIVEIASAAEGRTTTAWAHKLDIRTEKQSGGIASFMPLLQVPSEWALMVRPTWQTPTDLREDTARGVIENSIHFPRTGLTLLKPVTILGDSFSDAFTRSGIYLYFSDTYRMRWNQVPKLSAFARQLPRETKHVVIQMIEVQLVAMAAFADRDDIAEAVSIIDQRFASGG